MDTRTAIEFIDELEDVVRDCQGPLAKAFDVEVVWEDGFIYSRDGFDLTRDEAISAIDERLVARQSRTPPSPFS